MNVEVLNKLDYCFKDRPLDLFDAVIFKDQKLFQSVYDYVKSYVKEIEHKFKDHTINVPYLSPFIYKAVFPEFEIKDYHFNYLINKPNFYIYDKIDYEAENDCPLNCDLISFYDKVNDRIYFFLDDEFIDFLKSHQIKIRKVNLSDRSDEKGSFTSNKLFDVFYDMYVFEKLFYSENKKIRGFLDFNKEVQKFWNKKGYYFNLKCKKIMFDQNFLTWFHEKGMRINVDHSLTEFLRYENETKEDHFKDLKDLLTDNNRNYHFVDVYLDNLLPLEKTTFWFDLVEQFDKLKKNKKKTFLEIVKIIVNNESGRKLFARLTKSFDSRCVENRSVETIDNFIESITRIKNYKNKLNKMARLFHLLYVGGHSSLTDLCIFQNFDLPWINFLYRIEAIDDLIEKYKGGNVDRIIGVIESEIFNWNCDFASRNDIENLVEEFKSRIKQLEKLSKLADSTPIIQPIELSRNYYYGYQIVELVSSSQFEEEGNINNNCLNGKHRALSSSNRFFSIRDSEDNRHTVNLRKNRNNNWEIMESKGKNNKNPSQYKNNDREMIEGIQEFLKDELQNAEYRSMLEYEEEDELGI